MFNLIFIDFCENKNMKWMLVDVGLIWVVCYLILVDFNRFVMDVGRNKYKIDCG